MVWSDVGVAQDERKYALVAKDADADEERGKRMCVPGNLIQISVEKADVGASTSASSSATRATSIASSA